MIWKRNFVLGSGFSILPIWKVAMLVDEIVMEKMYTIFILRTHALSNFPHAKVKQDPDLKMYLILGWGESRTFSSLPLSLSLGNSRNLHSQFHLGSKRCFLLTLPLFLWNIYIFNKSVWNLPCGGIILCLLMFHLSVVLYFSCVLFSN